MPKKGNMSATDLSDLVQLGKNKSDDGNVMFGGISGSRRLEAAEQDQVVAGVPFFAGQDESVQFQSTKQVPGTPASESKSKTSKKRSKSSTPKQKLVPIRFRVRIEPSPMIILEYKVDVVLPDKSVKKGDKTYHHLMNIPNKFMLSGVRSRVNKIVDYLQRTNKKYMTPIFGEKMGKVPSTSSTETLLNDDAPAEYEHLRRQLYQSIISIIDIERERVQEDIL